MRKKFDSQSQIRILLFVVFIVGAIVSITSVSLYLLYNDSHKQIENLNAVYQENNSSVDLKETSELIALINTPIPNQTSG